MNCCKCSVEINPLRIKALPDTRTCVECSDVERNYVRTIISGKTTYSEIEVIKNKDTKEYLKRLDAKGRTGFGSSLYRASKSIPEPKASEMSKNTKRAMRRLPEYTQANFEAVLKEAMDWLDHDRNYAMKVVEKSYKQDTISGVQRRRMVDILNIFKPSPKVVKKSIEQEPVDDEILHAFRNWKY